jgi:hypothetical protein
VIILPSSQQILDDVGLRYRHTFTTSQTLVWFNEEQRELFDILELDSPPYTFQTVEGENFYPFPDGFDITKIKVVTYQINDADDPDYVEIPFYRNDDNQYAAYGKPWYTVTSDAMYLSDGDTVPADRNVYVYCDSDPTEVTTANVSSAPDLPTRYQEVLKLGILKRITAARQDMEMNSYFRADYEQKVSDLMWMRNLKEPEFISPVDMLPQSSRWRNERTAVVITQTD